jgi:hypothetical protein
MFVLDPHMVKPIGMTVVCVGVQWLSGCVLVFQGGTSPRNSGWGGGGRLR